MQRVAIARALVNNPEIILADEPTGALDTKTSVQIMEILKEISKDRLIIMVTHNPDLANEYSSRIIKLLDGKVIDDSNPCENIEYKKDDSKKKRKRIKKRSMKFFTALSLSLNNLMTKKGRTFLTAFGGSIGIIGIALILAISTGVQNYINKVEEDTLSSYPVTIEDQSVDMSSMMETMMGQNTNDTSTYEEGRIYSIDIMNDMLSSVSNKVKNNNLKELKKYLEEDESPIRNYTNAIDYSYDLKLNLYKEDTEDEIVKVNPSTVMSKVGFGDMLEARENSPIGSVMMSNTDVWIEMLNNEELLHSQYDLVAGAWPKKYNEVVLVVDENNQVSDYTLYSLGLKDQNELEKKFKVMEDRRNN